MSKMLSSSDVSPRAAIHALRLDAYMRVSTNRQADTDLSIPDQRRQILAWASLQGYAIAGEYVEPGASATDDRRPEFQRMIDHACNAENAVDAVVVHSYSRFFRESFGLEFYRRKLAKHGVKLISITQPFHDTTDPAQGMMRSIISMFDEYQSREIAKHVSRSMCENARQGFWNGARPPFGYRVAAGEQRGARIKKRLEIDHVEAETVQLVYRLYLEGWEGAGPMGVKAIAVWLNIHGYRTRQGSAWGTGPIHVMLTNTVYAGQAKFNVVDSKTRTRKPEKEHITFESPVVIELAVFERVQSTLKSRNPRISPPRVITGPILLTGLAFCATCAGAMTLRTGTSKTGKVHRYYSCSTCGRQGKSVCKGRSIKMDLLDSVVTNQLLDRVLAPERLSLMLDALAARRAEKSVAVDARISALEARAAEADDRLRRLYKMVEDGFADMDDILKDRITALKADRDTTRAALDRATGINRPSVALDPAKVAAFGKLMRDRLTIGGIPFRKAYLGAIIDRVEVDDHQIRILGRKDVLEQAVMANCGPVPGVRSFVRRWRPVRGSNPCYPRERRVS